MSDGNKTPRMWFVRMITDEGVYHPMHNGWIVRDKDLTQIIRMVHVMRSKMDREEYPGYDLTYDVVEFFGFGDDGDSDIAEL